MSAPPLAPVPPAPPCPAMTVFGGTSVAQARERVRPADEPVDCPTVRVSAAATAAAIPTRAAVDLHREEERALTRRPAASRAATTPIAATTTLTAERLVRRKSELPTLAGGPSV